jgi:hypothetical protein
MFPGQPLSMIKRCQYLSLYHSAEPVNATQLAHLTQECRESAQVNPQRADIAD